MEKDEKEKKYSIIEPFFKKKKKLRDIEKETEISYATLKRWVKQYKDLGKKGLMKKTRVDKNKYKKVNESTLIYLKELYSEYHSLPITKLYEKAKNTILSYNNMISYPTFFRIINNLDENIKKTSINSFRKETVYEYGIYQKALVLPFFDNKNKIFYLTVFYNKQNYKIVNIIFEEKKRDFKKIFNFIRESIIIEGEYPKNLSLDLNIEGVSKRLLKEIYFKTNINVIEEDVEEGILDLLKYIDTDILKEFEIKKPKEVLEVFLFIKEYLFLEAEKVKKLNLKNLEKLLYFVKFYKRKVYKDGILLKNNQYNHLSLKRYEAKIVEVFYNEFKPESIEIYLDGCFLSNAKLIK
ncbi:MAG: Mu transposase C-terminal domain-containing protein [Cetobacterium sp.]